MLVQKSISQQILKLSIQRQITLEVVTVMLIEVAEGTSFSKLRDTTLPLLIAAIVGDN